MTYTEFKKQAASTQFGDPLFLNFGAGAEANKELAKDDKYLKFIADQYDKATTDIRRQRIKGYFDREQRDRNIRYRSRIRRVAEAINIIGWLVVLPV